MSSRRESTNQIVQDLASLLGRSRPSFSIQQTETLQQEITNENLSLIEQKILRSTNPIEITEREEIEAIGQRGIWANKSEVMNWQGEISINEYSINEDTNPQIITKKVQERTEYIQELAIRYLRPPTPPAPGEIIITQKADVSTGPAPPLIIRQQPARSATPEPLVIREAPPQPPVSIGPKRVTISGKRIPPPPRKVVIERLAPIPTKPQNVIIERWLPYGETKRRVIFNKAAEVSAQVIKPRNVIVQWESPSVNIQQQVKYLGVIRANPAEYVQKYGPSLKQPNSLPTFITDIKTPSEVGVLAADYSRKSLIELEGELDGFKYINLDTEGLSEYRSYLISKGIFDLAASEQQRSQTRHRQSISLVSSTADDIFSMIDIDNSGYISIEEAEKVVLKLNSQLGRSYGEIEVKEFFLDICGDDNVITRSQFIQAFNKISQFGI